MAGSERRIVANFSTGGFNEVRRDLEGLGDKGKAVFERIATASRGVNAPLKAVSVASREAQDAMRGLASHAGAAGTVISSLGGKYLALAAGIGAVALAVGKGLRAYAEEERAQLRLQAVLRSTGDAAGVTAGHIGELAEKLERTTFFKKEDILQAAGALATFKAVSGDAFDSTIKLAADLAEVFGGDVTSNARILGKALQDPADGLTALKRIAGELPPDILKAAESLEKMGKHGEAVNLILRELEGRVGGSAQEAASGYAGAIDNLGDSFDDLLKSIGNVAANSGLTEFLQETAYWVDQIASGIGTIQSLDKGADDVVMSTVDSALSAFGIKSRSVPNSKRPPSKARGRVTGRPTSVSEPTVLSGYTIGTNGQLIPPAATSSTSTVSSSRETARHVAATAKSEKEAAEAAAEFAAWQHESEQQARELAKANEEMLRPLEHAFDRVQDSFADMLVEGRFSARSLVDIFKRAAAEIASAMIFRPIIGNIFGGLSGGGLVPGVSGSVAGGVGGGGLLSLSGLSSLGSGLLSGFNTPLVNPGIAFDIGSALGLGGGSVGALHQALGNFTPLSGLAGFGGGMAANLLGLSGQYSGVGSTLGGIAGTALFGPLGALGGSFLGSALGGMFGGGVKHPGASYGGRIGTSGAFTLDASQTRSKHMGAEGIIGESQAFGQFLQTLGASSTAKFRDVPFGGYYTPGGSVISLPGEKQSFFNSADPSSTASAFRDMALYMAKTATVIDDQLVDALEGVSTQGRDASAVLSAVVQRLDFIAGIKGFNDALATDPATSNLSPEELRRRASDTFYTSADNATLGKASLQEVQANALAFLSATQNYAGKASSLYASDLDFLRKRLSDLGGNPPRYAGGGDFAPGTFIVHPGETVMTSTTPGQVKNAAETRRMLGNAARNAFDIADLKELFGALLAEQRAVRSLLERRTA